MALKRKEGWQEHVVEQGESWRCHECEDDVAEGRAIHVLTEKQAEDDRYVWYPVRVICQKCHILDEL